MNIRKLARDEISAIWQIDRSEVIDNIYYLRDGKLVLEAEHFEMEGWPPGEPEHYTPILLDCYDRGGHFWGIFIKGEMIGAAILENKRIGSRKDTLQLKFLHVSCAYRQQGLGKKLFLITSQKARDMGAKKIYVSATPSENTVNFYMRMGCVLATEIDQELFKLEPEDIHLEYMLDRKMEK